MFVFQNKGIRAYVLSLIPMYLDTLQEREKVSAPLQTFENFLYTHDIDAYTRASSALLKEAQKKAWRQFIN